MPTSSKNYFIEDFLSKSFIPLSAARDCGSELHAIKCHIDSLSNINIPDEADLHDVKLNVHLYDTISKCYFGRGCTSKAKAISIENQRFSVELNADFYVLTSIADNAIVLILEVVGIPEDPSQDEFSCGWGILRPFKKTLKLDDVADDTTCSNDHLKLYYGTPKAIVFLKDPIEAEPILRLSKGSSIDYFLKTHKKLQDFKKFLPKNCIIAAEDVVPGISDVTKQGHGDPFQSPQLCHMSTVHLDSLELTLTPDIEKFEKKLCSRVCKSSVGKQNAALIKDNNTIKDDLCVSVKERWLNLGVHNGWKFIDEIQETSLSMLSKKEPSILVTPPIDLLEVPDDPNTHIVFYIKYILRVPTIVKQKKEVTVDHLDREFYIRWLAWQPFSVGMKEEVDLDMIGGPAANPMSVLIYQEEPGGEPVQMYFHQRKSHATIDRRLSIRRRSASKFDEVDNSKDIVEEEQESGERIVTSKHQVTKDVENIKVVPAYSSQQPDVVPLEMTEMRTAPMSPMPYQGYYAQYPSIKASYPTEVQHMDASVEMAEIPYTPVHAPVMAQFGSTSTTARTSAMSRAAYARIYSSGFPSIKDRHGEMPHIVDPSDHMTFDPKIEAEDHLKCNEIVFQALAFSRLFNPEFSLSPQTKDPGSLFLTYTFYRFPQVTTERMMLGPPESELTTDPQTLPCILHRIGKDGHLAPGAPGLTLKYYMDPADMKPGENAAFARYLASFIMHIDIWDGDSMLLIGSCAVELKHLVRQGAEAVQVTHELDVITTEYTDDTPNLTGDLTRGGSVRPIGVSTVLKGRLHLRLANIGYPASHKLYSKPTPIHTQHVVKESSIGTFTGGSISSGYYRDTGDLQQTAKLLPTTDKQLASMIMSMKTGRTSLKDPDDTKSRKIERMETVRKNQNNSLSPQVEEASLKKESIVQRTREFKMIQDFRDKSKTDGIISLLQAAITTHHTLYPSYGTAEFFEFHLQNPYNYQVTLMVDLTSEELRIVKDPREWRYFKAITDTHTPMEENMFNVKDDVVELFLRARESVYVPFRYQSFAADICIPENLENATLSSNTTIHCKDAVVDAALQSKKLKVLFKGPDLRPVCILAISIEPQPQLIDQTFRFHQPEQSFLKKMVRLPPFHTIPGVDTSKPVNLRVRCSDTNVIATTRNHKPNEPMDVYVKVAVGTSPSTSKFYILTYVDEFMVKPCQTWRFFVHTLHRVDVSCTEGQTSRFNLILRGTQASRLVRCFNSHPREMQVIPSDPFMLMANNVHELEVAIRPLRVGNKFIYINVVDVEFHQVIRSWLICLSCRLPVITKAFEITVPMGGGKGSSKKITYTNPYPLRKLFKFRTNRDDLVQFKETEAEVGGRDGYPMGLRFVPVANAGMAEILIFVNDFQDRNEETFCIKATYMPL